MILDCKLTISDGTGNTKLLALIDSNTSFNFISSPVAKHLGWLVRPNTTPLAVKIVSGTEVGSLDIASRLVLSGEWQAYVIFLMLDVPLKVIFSMPWLLLISPQLV